MLPQQFVAFILLVSVGSCLGGYSTENPDPFCKQLLSSGKPQELREWLKGKSNTLGELASHKECLQLANEIYTAGALHVFAVEIDKYPEGENTGKLVIELPNDASGRRKVLEWAGKIAREHGFDAYTDVGQQYVFVMLD
jgi:hypothetical protein